jgi:hypothetical protein
MDEKSIKADFHDKLEEVTDPAVLFETAIPVLKRRVRVEQEAYDKERQDVENMLQNPTYLTALNQAELAKRDLSIATWKLQEAIKRLQVLGSGVDEDDGTGVFDTAK